VPTFVAKCLKRQENDLSTAEVGVVSVDDERRELLSRESGGPVRCWNHRIAIGPDGENTCRYTDEIAIEAGVLTPLVWAYAHLFYRYRQMRKGAS